MKRFLRSLIVFSVAIFTTNLFATETTIKKINKPIKPKEKWSLDNIEGE